MARNTSFSLDDHYRGFWIAKLPHGVTATPAMSRAPRFDHWKNARLVSCRLRLNPEQPASEWVLVNVATPTDSLRLAAQRIDRWVDGTRFR